MKAELFSKDAQEFLRLLAKHEVRYLLIGGHAVIYHGYARLTEAGRPKDLDDLDHLPE